MLTRLEPRNIIIGKLEQVLQSVLTLQRHTSRLVKKLGRTKTIRRALKPRLLHFAALRKWDRLDDHHLFQLFLSPIDLLKVLNAYRNN